MVLVATQVKRRRGTTAENDAFTGAEGEIVVDTERHELRVHDGVTQGGFRIGGGSGSGRNIGDIFYTMRKDTGLAGAVECNGATYNTTDFQGADNIGALLEAGKLPYVSMSQYATLLSTNGSVGVFGWNGSGNTEFRVPSLNDIFIETGTVAQIGDYLPAGIPNITGEAGMGDRGANISASGAFVAARLGSSTPKYTTQSNTNSTNNGWTFDASASSDVYKDDVDTVQPNTTRYRAMVQLMTGATDEAFATCSEVLADVAGLKDMNNITSTGKETVVGWGLPDYSAGISINNNTDYTCPTDGFLIATGYSSNASASNMLLNGSEIIRGIYNTAQYTYTPFILPVRKNDVVRVQFTGATVGQGIIFYPYKGV